MQMYDVKDGYHVICYRFVGDLEKVSNNEGASIFERKVVRTREKRKREEKGDPADVEGYKGTVCDTPPSYNHI